VVAEALGRLDFLDPHSMQLRHALAVPGCAGVDHMDYTADARRALVSCEFAGRMIVVDLGRERVIKTIPLRRGAMPQDVKLSPDGRTFYVADMASNGVWLIDAHTLRKIRFQPTGKGAHGVYPSRDERRLFVTNRGEGTITVLSFRTRRPIRKWRLRDQHAHRPAVASHPRRQWPARAVCLAAARALLDRPHRHPALSAMRS
jgi:DNA-binding beta-propeller fold protein YncE